MNDLDQAIQIAGGVGALAKAIGVPSQNSISMWRKRGSVPVPWMRIIQTEILKKKRRSTQSGGSIAATEKEAA